MYIKKSYTILTACTENWWKMKQQAYKDDVSLRSFIKMEFKSYNRKKSSDLNMTNGRKMDPKLMILR